MATKQLTPMQEAFAAAKAAGLSNRDAGVHAGYSPVSADVQAAQLMRREDIKAAIKAAKKKRRGNGGKSKGETDDWDGDGAGEKAEIDKLTMPKKRYTDAKEFLTDAMNHPKLPIALRGEYAKALLPYQHGKVGDIGKKEAANNRARKVAGADAGKPQRAKFGTKQPPGLRVVNGGKT